MADTNVIFLLDGIETSIQCTREDKMKDICQKYSSKINKNMNTLLFLHEGNKINFDLTIEEQSKFQDNEKNEMKILVHKNNNGNIIYSKIKLKIELNNQKINDIISKNNKIKNKVNEVKISIGLMKKINNNFNLNPMNIQFQNIHNIQGDIQKNNVKLKYFIKGENNIKNNNYRINDNNLSLADAKPLENLKSKYILKIIFSYSNEKRKLKLIKYNKNLQNKMDEENRKGKEYNFEDGLVFEGEYLNGERNGKGREYYCFNKILRFEGEYLNGKKWNGKGNDNFNKFAYELKNGKGFIKEYGYEGELIFEGEYLDGEKMEKEKNIIVLIK